MCDVIKYLMVCYYLNVRKRRPRGNVGNLIGEMEDTVGWCVHIHPVALFTVVDSYERRQESSKRVIGTLLGSREKGLVEIRSGYAVPHNETEEEVNLRNGSVASLWGTFSCLLTYTSKEYEDGKI